MTTLSEILLWILGPGAGVLAWWLLHRVECFAGDRPAWRVLLQCWFGDLAPGDKRLVAFGLAGLLAVGAYLVTLGMGYRVPPGAWRQWVEVLVSVVAEAIVASQIAHASVDLRATDDEDAAPVGV